MTQMKTTTCCFLGDVKCFAKALKMLINSGYETCLFRSLVDALSYTMSRVESSRVESSRVSHLLAHSPPDRLSMHPKFPFNETYHDQRRSTLDRGRRAKIPTHGRSKGARTPSPGNKNFDYSNSDRPAPVRFR